MLQPRPRSLALLGLAASLLLLPGCSRQGVPEGGSTISGQVTYNGKPVSYGFVLFYDMKDGLDPKTATVAPVGMGKIGENGNYEATHVPAGTLMVCVATDPEIPVHELIGPRSLGGALDPKALLGGPGAPGADAGGKGGPPGKGGAVFDPKKAPPAEGKGSAPPLPPVMHSDARELTIEQQQMLKNIHAKYGGVGTSPLQYEVKDGIDETYDIRLK
jgi:hypothetical protein